MSKNFSLALSKSGVPCLWEQGGGNTNTGDSQVITGGDGLPKKPIYIRTRGDLSCGQHALIPVSVGDFVVETNHHRRDFEIRVWQIVSVHAAGESPAAAGELVTEFSQGEWSNFPEPIGDELFKNIFAAVEAAKAKATCYHCREPHFIQA